MQTVTGARPADTGGKTLGIVVFLLGVGMLIAVFVLAYLDLVAAAQASALSRLLNLPATLLYKGALLFIMGIVASAIANKGIALYQAARATE
jgi:heme/copper-type cytochrome/quinol oxidase subunit 3